MGPILSLQPFALSIKSNENHADRLDFNITTAQTKTQFKPYPFKKKNRTIIITAIYLLGYTRYILN